MDWAPSDGVLAIITTGYVAPLFKESSIFTFSNAPRFDIHLMDAFVPLVSTVDDRLGDVTFTNGAPMMKFTFDASAAASSVNATRIRAWLVAGEIGRASCRERG